MRVRHFVLQAFAGAFTLLALYGCDASSPADSPAALTKWLEQRWPLDAILKFCTPERRHDDASQNLVAMDKAWEGQLYIGKKTGFDKIFWYGESKNGRLEAYSLNATRGDDWWLLEIVGREYMNYPPIVEPDPSRRGFVGHK